MAIQDWIWMDTPPLDEIDLIYFWDTILGHSAKKGVHPKPNDRSS